MRKKESSTILIDLLLLCLVGAVLIMLVGCGKIPDYPETWQCAFSKKYETFFCVNTKTKDKIRIPTDDPTMKNAQCVSLDDYKKGETWVKTVKAIAERKCR